MSNNYERAVDFALDAHRGQRRKDGSIYILHPLEVSVIAGTMTRDEDVLAAAVLHDTVEDTPVTAQDILDNFGEKIAELVAHETENKRPELPAAETWKIRKEESLAVLKDSPRDSKILWISDKLSNMRSLSRDYADMGEAVFERFNEKNPRIQRWYHQTVLEYTSELAEYAAYKEYEFLFNMVFGDYE
ncbi:MAG: bifunctional (p)ppGpp synthetase/guanosine-3',5'-bis(diphosphate) 3'-pyrophosphohydrolase [Eubacterium sp.]|nr:bifunctional (p)ppGpp synthetase/guanosine-3',5'-bis(diphosphate) 3'-pyrophosphohydrolase [Eubacterium sp.]